MNHRSQNVKKKENGIDHCYHWGWQVKPLWDIATPSCDLLWPLEWTICFISSNHRVGYYWCVIVIFLYKESEITISSVWGHTFYLSSLSGWCLHNCEKKPHSWTDRDYVDTMSVKELIFFPFLYKGKSFVLWISQNQYGSNTHFIFNTDFLSDFFSAFMLINLQVNSVSLNACLPQSKLLKRWVLNNWGKTEPVLKSQLIKKNGETSEFPPTKVKMNFFVLLHNSIYLASHISCLQYVSTM